MYLTTLFDQDFLNDFFDDPFFRNSSRDMRKLEKKIDRKERNLMKTDVKETADAYEMKVELPGFRKENIKISLNDGYLTIFAEKHGEDGSEGKFIRRERYSGSCQRSFYVGEELHEDQIRAEFKHGVLKIDLPKKKEEPQIEEPKYISIE